MTQREEWRMFYGIVRRRWNAEEEGPEHYFAGLPKKWCFAIEYAAWGNRDPLGDRRPGRVLRMLREKRNPRFKMSQFNCRCTVRPITLDDKTGP